MVRVDQSESSPQSEPVTDFQGHTREVLSKNFAGIMEMMAKKSIEGSLAHAKYFFDLAGVREELRRQIENNGEPTLADILLEKLRSLREEGIEVASREPNDTHGVADANNHTVQAGTDCGARAE